MDDVGQMEQLEMEMELNEKDHQIETLTHQLHLLKSRLDESDPEFTSSPPPTPPPSETPPSPPPALIPLLRSQITQLIHSNDLLTTENSDLLQTLAKLRSQHATTLSSLSDIQDECDTLKASKETAEREKSGWAKEKEAWEKEKEKLEGGYEGEKKKREEAEEVVGVLREKVEEARRGVMRLQAEKRIGGASAPPPNASVGNLGDDLGLPVSIGGGEKTSRADKRASLNVNFGSSNNHPSSFGFPSFSTGGVSISGSGTGRPLTLNAHRRSSSISDSAVPLSSFATSHAFSHGPPLSSFLPPATTNSKGLRELRLSQLPPNLPTALAAAPPASGGGGTLSSFLGFGSSSAAKSPSAQEPSDPIEAARLRLEGGGPPSSRAPASRRSSTQSLLPPIASHSFSNPSSPTSHSPLPLPPATLSPEPIISPAELALARSEAASLRTQLATAQAAREASEKACKALREFMALSHPLTSGGSASASASSEGTSGEGVIVGLGLGTEGLRLPPLPSDMDDDDDDEEEGGKKGPFGSVAIVTAPPPPAPPASTRGWSLFGSRSRTTTATAANPDPSPSLSPGQPGVASPDPTSPQPSPSAGVLSPPVSAPLKSSPSTSTKSRFNFFASSSYNTSSDKDKTLPSIPPSSSSSDPTPSSNTTPAGIPVASLPLDRSLSSSSSTNNTEPPPSVIADDASTDSAPNSPDTHESHTRVSLAQIVEGGEGEDEVETPVENKDAPIKAATMARGESEGLA